MKQIDYLKLVNTGRKSSRYVRPSAEDEALKGVIGIGAVITLISTFGLGVLASYFGETMSMEILAKPMGTTFLIAVLLLVCGIFIGGAPTITRVCIAIVTSAVTLVLLVLASSGSLETQYLFAPLALFSVIVASVSARLVVVLGNRHEAAV
ncbi:MAG: hypothetical protein RLN85_14465 [Pseudomonadales bacterium]